LVPIPFLGMGEVVTYDSSSFSTSGVSFLMHSQNLVFVLGADAPAIFGVPAGGTNSFLSYFGVGDGSPANSVAMEAEAKGFTTGTTAVTVGGAPAPGARVAVGPLRTRPREAASKRWPHFVTDAAGCYSAQIPLHLPGRSRSEAAAPWR
jgi:hypothetical protein